MTARYRSAAAWLARAAVAALSVTLALLPFEARLGALAAGPLILTPVELAWSLAVGLWLLQLLAERRKPRLPLPVATGVAVLLVGGIVSAVAANGYNDEALRFVGRSLAGWLLLIAVADSVGTARGAKPLAAAIVAGAAISAAVGLLAFSIRPLDALAWLARDEYRIESVLRLQATFDYPNTAAMTFEASALVGVALLAAVRSTSARLAIGLAVALIIVAMLFTYSRGATIGLTAGLLTVVVLAARARRRALAAVGGMSALCVIAGSVVVTLAALPLNRLWDEGNRAYYGAAYEAPPTVALSPSSEFGLTVAVTNTSTVTWNGSDDAVYNLGFRWLDPVTGRIQRDGEVRLSTGRLAPAERVVLAFSIPTPPATGTYLIGWDMVHEDVTWFSERGVPMRLTEIRVGLHPPTTTVPPAAPPPVGDPYPELRGDPPRLELWRAALLMTAERPLFGVGPGTYRLRYGDYLGWSPFDTRIHSNNMYLELAATTGLVGLAAFLVVVGVPMRRLVHRLWSARAASRSDEPPDGWLVRAFVLAAVVAFLAHGMVDYFLGFTPTAGLFWALLGLAIGLSSATRPPAAPAEARTDRSTDG